MVAYWIKKTRQSCVSPYPRLETPCWPLWLDAQKCVIRMLWVRVKNLIFLHKTRVSLNSFDAYSSCMCQDRSWKWGPAIFIRLLSWDVNRPHGETLEEHGGTKRRKAWVIILESSYVIFLLSKLHLFVQSFCLWTCLKPSYTALHGPGEATSKGEVVAKVRRLSKGEELITDVSWRFMTFQVRKGKTVMSCSCMYVTVNVCI